MNKLSLSDWKKLTVLERPYAYDPETEIAFSKKEYKKRDNQ